MCCDFFVLFCFSLCHLFPTELATVDNQRFSALRNSDSGDRRPVPVDEVYFNACRSAVTSFSSCPATGNMPSSLPISDLLITNNFQDAVLCNPSGESESTTAQVLMPFPGQGPSSLGSSSSSSLPSSVASRMDGSNPHRALTAVSLVLLYCRLPRMLYRPSSRLCRARMQPLGVRPVRGNYRPSRSTTPTSWFLFQQTTEHWAHAGSHY